MRYGVILERDENGFGAYVPDPPGCVAVEERRSVAFDPGDRRAAFGWLA